MHWNPPSLSLSPHFDHRDIRCSTISLVQHVRNTVRTTMVSGPYHFLGGERVVPPARRKNDVQKGIQLVAKRASVFSSPLTIISTALFNLSRGLKADILRSSPGSSCRYLLPNQSLATTAHCHIKTYRTTGWKMLYYLKVV